MITCRELIDFLDEYIGNEMSPDQRQAVDRHLSVCPDCVKYVEQYRQTIALGRAAFENENDSAPANVPAGLIKAVLEFRNA